MSARQPIDYSEFGHIALDGAILVEVFDGVLNDLGLANRNDAKLRQEIANQIVTYARVGVHDRARLRKLVFEAVRLEQRPSIAGHRQSDGTRPILRPNAFLRG
jgi:hypothetical protein